MERTRSTHRKLPPREQLGQKDGRGDRRSVDKPPMLTIRKSNATNELHTVAENSETIKENQRKNTNYKPNDEGRKGGRKI